jgi:hypothetical protein
MQKERRLRQTTGRCPLIRGEQGIEQLALDLSGT